MDNRVTPREWQVEALRPIATEIQQTGAATLSAAPGAGKTVFAGLVYQLLHAEGMVDRLVVLVPRVTLVKQWVEALAESLHIQLKPASAVERPGQHGVVATYQSLGNRDQLDAHRTQAANRRTLLVLDEVHHLGEAGQGGMRAWARAVTELAGDVEAHDLRVAGVLNLSGTLWRSSANERISTVRYSRVDENTIQSVVDYEISAARLIDDGQLRPIDLYRLGTHVTLDDYQNLEVVEGNLSDLDEKSARAAVSPSPRWISGGAHS